MANPQKENGYIKLYRKIIDTSFYKKPNTLHLAIHLLLKANHKPTKFIFNNKETVLEQGQCITGLFELKKETGLSIQNIRTSLDILTNCHFLTKTSTSKFTIVSICNYNQYQDKVTRKVTRKVTNQQQTSNKPVTTYKNVKNVKNVKNNYLSSKENILKEKFLEFVYLTKEEYQKLIDKLGKEETENYIDKLNNYIGSKGVKYKSHYHTILNWSYYECKNGTREDKYKHLEEEISS